MIHNRAATGTEVLFTYEKEEALNYAKRLTKMGFPCTVQDFSNGCYRVFWESTGIQAELFRAGKSFLESFYLGYKFSGTSLEVKSGFTLKGNRKKQLEGIANSFKDFLENVQEMPTYEAVKTIHKLKGYCEQLLIIASE